MSGSASFQRAKKSWYAALALWRCRRRGRRRGPAQVRQCADRLVPDDAGMVENFLELGCGCAALVRCQISLAAQINGVESETPGLSGRPEFIGRSRGERFECLGGAAALESNGGTDHRQVVELHDRVFGEAFGSGRRPAAWLERRRPPDPARWPIQPQHLCRSSRASAACACCFAWLMLPTQRLAHCSFGLVARRRLFFICALAESDARRVSSRALANCPP